MRNPGSGRTSKRRGLAMNGMIRLGIAALISSLAAWGCAGLDNPTALVDLVLDVDFEVEATRVETLEEVEIHVQVMEGGERIAMRQSQLEVGLHGGVTRMVEMHQEGDGYAAHVTFYEPGEYHLAFHGMPERHWLSHELGEHEIDVYRHHVIVGSYWVEIESSPAPVLENGEAHIHLMVYDLLPDGTPGSIAAGLDVEVEVHGLDGTETALGAVEETPGEYEIQYAFGEAGMYEFHVEIGQNRGEFRLPVIDPDAGEEVPAEEEGDGHGHGH